MRLASAVSSGWLSLREFCYVALDLFVSPLVIFVNRIGWAIYFAAFGEGAIIWCVFETVPFPWFDITVAIL